MINSSGKLLEALIKPRLTTAVRNAGDLSEKQYGFRKGRSTINAIQEIVTVVEKAQEGNHFSRKIVLLMTLDVKNAFNSVRWTDMMKALKEKFKVPQYLLRMFESYLSGRVLLYETTEGTRCRNITAGAAQGSILGPDLWNVTYDEILGLHVAENSFFIGYADDIAAVIEARNVEQAIHILNVVMGNVTMWMENHGLSLAMEKTDILIITRNRIPVEIPVQIEETKVRSQKEVNLLCDAILL